MPRITLYVTEDLQREIDEVRGDVSLSQIFAQGFELWRHGVAKRAPYEREIRRLRAKAGRLEKKIQAIRRIAG